MTKEIEEFLANGGEIKKLLDEVIKNNLYKKQTRCHFSNEAPLKVNQFKPATLSNNQLSKLPEITLKRILSKRYKALRRNATRKEISKQKRLERLTII